MIYLLFKLEDLNNRVKQIFMLHTYIKNEIMNHNDFIINGKISIKSILHKGGGHFP